MVDIAFGASIIPGAKNPFNNIGFMVVYSIIFHATYKDDFIQIAFNFQCLNTKNNLNL